MIILGIETSCDETALALIETRNSNSGIECRIISSLIHSQAELHSKYGGVFPTLAKREHGKNLIPLLENLLNGSGDRLKTINRQPSVEIPETLKNEIQKNNPDLWSSISNASFLKDVPLIDRIAVTEGPGLEPALWVGINFAQILSSIWSIPVIPVNHMEGHIVGSLIDADVSNNEWQTLKTVSYPAVALLISGGHTELVKIEIEQTGELKYEIIGQTRDDAVGEAFDKTARLLGLPYPGGPHISKLSADAKEKGIFSPIKLPRPMIHSHNLEFSFSGLKTAVLYAVRDQIALDPKLSEDFKMGLAREFEDAVIETLSAKLKMAIDETYARTLIIGGGVSANLRLREAFEQIANQYNIAIYLPSQHISGDNALMIALAGALDIKKHSRPLIADGTKRLDYRN